LLPRIEIGGEVRQRQERSQQRRGEERRDHPRAAEGPDVHHREDRGEHDGGHAAIAAGRSAEGEADPGEGHAEGGRSRDAAVPAAQEEGQPAGGAKLPVVDVAQPGAGGGMLPWKIWLGSKKCMASQWTVHRSTSTSRWPRTWVRTSAVSGRVAAIARARKKRAASASRPRACLSLTFSCSRAPNQHASVRRHGAPAGRAPFRPSGSTPATAEFDGRARARMRISGARSAPRSELMTRRWALLSALGLALRLCLLPALGT